MQSRLQKPTPETEKPKTPLFFQIAGVFVAVRHLTGGRGGIEPPLLLGFPEIFQKSYCRLRPNPLNFSPSGPSTRHSQNVLDEAEWRSMNFEESSIFKAEPSEIWDGFCVMVAKSYRDALRVRRWCKCPHDLLQSPYQSKFQKANIRPFSSAPDRKGPKFTGEMRSHWSIPMYAAEASRLRGKPLWLWLSAAPAKSSR